MFDFHQPAGRVVAVAQELMGVVVDFPLFIGSLVEAVVAVFDDRAGVVFDFGEPVLLVVGKAEAEDPAVGAGFVLFVQVSSLFDDIAGVVVGTLRRFALFSMSHRTVP
ncbi:MAG TPA: hypothetical protein PKA28_00095 [Methylomusa anaerophila]|uniref:hypothetical protein n=1 Tax=Methylomusa anaerophila TaxID=1930071 RepID=UPI002BCB7D6B|nr:hypothetical protein [Methylomusa anaerophila]HML86830.1 hypothetical protein [Methylomusa anaerophila]